MSLFGGLDSLLETLEKEFKTDRPDGLSLTNLWIVYLIIRCARAVTKAIVAEEQNVGSVIQESPGTTEDSKQQSGNVHDVRGDETTDEDNDSTSEATRRGERSDAQRVNERPTRSESDVDTDHLQEGSDTRSANYSPSRGKHTKHRF